MVFYQCLKCQKKWQQPVGVCPFCFSGLERIKSKKATVIACSKVLISNLLHPKVPYYALVIEDEFGVKSAYKSMKEVGIGEELIFSSTDNDDAVAIWKAGYDLLDSIENVVELLELKLTKDSKVLVLPTLISPVHNYFRDNTSTEFLNAVLEYLSNAGIKNIKIATQSFSDVSAEALAQKSGLLDVCLKHKIVPFDLAKTGFEKMGKVSISKEVREADVVINISALKSGKAVSVENIFRLVERDNYQALKYLYGDDFLVEEIKKLKNIFTIGEAINPQRIDKFPVFRSLVFASKNALNLDAVFNETGSVNNIPKYIKGINVSKVPTVGRTISEIKRNIDIVL